jgi:hypothetical protein
MLVPACRLHPAKGAMTSVTHMRLRVLALVVLLADLAWPRTPPPRARARTPAHVAHR